MKPVPAVEAIDNAIEWIKQSNAEEGTSNLYCTQLRGLEDLRQQVLDAIEALKPLANLDLRPDGFDKRPSSQIIYARDNTRITVGNVRIAARTIQRLEGTT